MYKRATDKIVKKYIDSDGIETIEITSMDIPRMTHEDFKGVMEAYDLVLMENPVYYGDMRCKGLIFYPLRKILIDMSFLDTLDILIHEGLHGFYTFMPEYFIEDIFEKYSKDPEIRRIAKEKLLDSFKGQEREISVTNEYRPEKHYEMEWI